MIISYETMNNGAGFDEGFNNTNFIKINCDRLKTQHIYSAGTELRNNVPRTTVHRLALLMGIFTPGISIE